jgi:hypothetical protein
MCSAAFIGLISPTAREAGGSPGSGSRRRGRGIGVLVGLIFLIASATLASIRIGGVDFVAPTAESASQESGLEIE